ncbi:MAG: glycosyltransferase family 2 protein [Anaerolineales bacterium]|nr:glycosyltransferase family 2 protein [Anaerolineales bacterium]
MPDEKNSKSPTQPLVAVVVLTHIPFASGYHKHKLDVLRVCLKSIQKNTFRPYKLLVFDNGSGSHVQRFLQQELGLGNIDTLLRSEQNIGKIGAFRMIFRAVSDKYIAYFDDDVYVYPGWLEAHLAILDLYPDIGMVSGVAIRERFSHAIASNLKFATSHPQAELSRGRFLTEKTEREFVESTGRWWPRYQAETAGIEDLLIRYKGLSAYAAANHFQFVGPTAVLRKGLPAEWSGRLMGEMREFDERLDNFGYLRLSTVERCVRHLGNQLTPDYYSLVEQLGFNPIHRSQSAFSIFLRRVLVKLPGLKRLNYWLNQRLFDRLEMKRRRQQLAECMKSMEEKA